MKLPQGYKVTKPGVAVGAFSTYYANQRRLVLKAPARPLVSINLKTLRLYCLHEWYPLQPIHAEWLKRGQTRIGRTLNIERVAKKMGLEKKQALLQLRALQSLLRHVADIDPFIVYLPDHVIYDMQATFISGKYAHPMYSHKRYVSTENSSNPACLAYNKSRKLTLNRIALQQVNRE
jgi:hypothetical protein